MVISLRTTNVKTSPSVESSKVRKLVILPITLFSVTTIQCFAEDNPSANQMSSHFALAMDYRKDRKFNLAEQEYSVLLKLDPKNPELNCSRGFMKLEQKKFKSALEDAVSAEKLTTLNGRLFWVAMLKSRAYAGLNDMKNATKFYLEASSRQPERADAPFELGALYFKKHRYDEALQSLNSAVRILSSRRTNEHVQKQIDDAKTMIAAIELKQNTKEKKPVSKSKKLEN